MVIVLISLTLIIVWTVVLDLALRWRRSWMIVVLIWWMVVSLGASVLIRHKLVVAVLVLVMILILVMVLVHIVWSYMGETRWCNVIIRTITKEIPISLGLVTATTLVIRPCCSINTILNKITRRRTIIIRMRSTTCFTTWVHGFHLV